MNHSAQKFALLTFGITVLAGPIHRLGAQTALPPTAPTAVTPSQLPSANPSLPRGGTTAIQWDGHLLRISANGESLAEVLREIASRAGIRVSGSPPSDAIYGTYGPAPLEDVLSDLVSGLSVNMLFVDRAGTLPARLTFTARNGGPTPAAAPTNIAQQQPQNPTPQPSPFPAVPASNISANPGFASPGAANTSGPSSNSEAPASASQPADASGNPASPNGVKTPQEIFEQLQRLRATAGAQH